jgi:molybdopterin molybdotransferase
MADIGAALLFRGVAIAPGRSIAVARCQGTLIFGLPGSPWAAFVTFETLVRPVLDVLLGRPAAQPVTAVLTADISARPGVTHLLPVRLQSAGPHPEATPLRDLLTVSRSETDSLGMLATPANRRQLPVGTRVRIWPL